MRMIKMNDRILLLEDGTMVLGKGFGGANETPAEVIFNTSMTGYQEALSDPSYYGNIVIMTFPTIGSVGINRDDFESITPHVKGVVVKSVSHDPSNFRSEET